MGPNALLGMAMAFETKTHAQRLGVENFIHVIDLPVAFHAADAAVHMNGVIEINVVRNFMDLHPGNGRVVLDTVTHQLQARIVLQHLIVTVHAGGAGRNV